MNHNLDAARGVFFVEMLSSQFDDLHETTCALVRLTTADLLYRMPRADSADALIYSCGEHVLRSAAAVEQTFGGITANLWDDPFEWTLPETLATPALILDYLAETAATRERGFRLIKCDDDLQRRIATPAPQPEALGGLLLHTLRRASHHLGAAFAVFRLFSNARLPRL